MKTSLLVISMLLFSGCMSAAQKAKEQERVNAIVRSLSPEQRAQLELQMLLHKAGLDATRENISCYQVGGSIHCTSY